MYHYTFSSYEKQYGDSSKNKDNIAIQSSNPTSGYTPEEFKAGSQGNICTSMVIAALFTIAQKWKQPKCLLTDGWINKMWYRPYSGILFSLKKERNSDTCYNMDES